VDADRWDDSTVYNMFAAIQKRCNARTTDLPQRYTCNLHRRGVMQFALDSIDDRKYVAGCVLLL
jgi:hypothetical protein